MYVCAYLFLPSCYGQISRSNLSNPLRRSAVVQAIEQARPSVVSITTEAVEQNPFAMVYGGVSSSDGSGVVIRSRGAGSHECPCCRTSPKDIGILCR